ncbi:hypothetical protein A2715_05060 [Candidatus Woesebacteria bacterium RIFCSPHIGHO2_01_FULL_39_32]|uniref:Glycosyltransferase 2-like domain-containing protein n=1 Tax=Candidatus Woesebacteria bacterium RIFCSPLOWO2_01_FULL_39_25 TaxID=1802521 RepID=A0A1F8BMM5_9BACT|nr:MAG: hypothetical protein A2124_05060 [Candidatus Woesebacteria bacterium GWB1_37_5]OGM25388.1 MAG: hypothetical protein A2715_05060 [Candidatus Woesebacteria bacterium RIFCSPHIGHO2_01_FULL_39_32]OGM64919.1 MAG: hypothetical protein A2893_04670 [Candidatus Woesebacteria bacterium RIFCSPLOWO2_01_FULL_39_25]
MKIWAHSLVRNEERYLWFAVTSVIDYVYKVLLWDTGSSDNTLNIIRELRKAFPNKIDFKQVREVDKDKFTLMRQKMLDQTKSDWVILVDGDEVWWDDSIKKIVETIHSKGNSLETLVHGYYNVIGDIYHYQEEKAGRYTIDGHVGHLTIRAINQKIPGLHFGKPHGQQGIFDSKERLIQDRDKKKRFFIDEKLYLHFTHMIRSSSLKDDLKVMKRDIKAKHELGTPFPLDFYYPEVFFKPRPDIVHLPWSKMGSRYFLRAFFETPLRKFKRRVFKGKSGY